MSVDKDVKAINPLRITMKGKFAVCLDRVGVMTMVLYLQGKDSGYVNGPSAKDKRSKQDRVYELSSSMTTAKVKISRRTLLNDATLGAGMKLGHALATTSQLTGVGKKKMSHRRRMRLHFPSGVRDQKG